MAEETKTKAAAEEKTATEETESVETPPEESTESEENPETEESEETSISFDGLNEDSLRVATALYKGLSNPETAERTIRSVAESIGVKIQQEIDDPKSTKSDKLTLGQFVESKLKTIEGGRFESLAPLLTSLFEGFSEEFLEPKFSATQQQTQAQMAENAYNKLGEKYEDFFDKAKEIDELSKIMSPTAPLKTQKDFEKYMEILYRAAGGNVQSSKSIARTVDKIKKNSKGSGLAPSGGSGSRNKPGSSRVSIQDAIQAALEGKTLE